MSYFTHLECSRAVRRGPLRSARRTAPLHLRRSPAGALRPRRGARVDAASRSPAREPNMWRYRELMPLFDGEAAAHARRRLDAADPRAAARRATLGLERLFVKDESLNPTNSFKARGLSAAVTRAAHLGAKTLSVPSAGNAANAMAAYAARGRHRGQGLHAEGRQGPVHPRVRAVRRRRHARRRPDHRRRPHRRRDTASRSAGTTSRR